MTNEQTKYQYNGLLFDHKKKQSTNKSCSIDQPRKHNAKWKKPNTKDHIYYDSIYMKCPELANLWRQRMGGDRNWEWLLTDMEFLLRGGGMEFWN